MKPSGPERHGRFYATSERFYEGMLNAYDRSLKQVLARPRTTVIVAGLLLLATVYLYILIPKGFLPSEDIGQITGTTEAEQGISFEAMVGYHQALAAILRQDPNIRSFQSNVGAGGSRTGNYGTLTIYLKPRSERKMNPDEVIQKLRPKLATVPGIRVFLQNPPPIRIGGYSSKSQYQFALQSPDTNELYRYASDLEAKMRELPGLQDVSSDLQMKSPQIDIEINKDKASALGISAQQVENALSTAYAGTTDLHHPDPQQ